MSRRGSVPAWPALADEGGRSWCEPECSEWQWQWWWFSVTLGQSRDLRDLKRNIGTDCCRGPEIIRLTSQPTALPLLRKIE